jgi:hypothetical protein
MHLVEIMNNVPEADVSTIEIVLNWPWLAFKSFECFPLARRDLRI